MTTHTCKYIHSFTTCYNYNIVSDDHVVVVVVSYIQRIGSQPEKSTLHDGQSRSCSADNFMLFKKNLNASKPSEHPPRVEECLKV